MVPKTYVRECQPPSQKGFRDGYIIFALPLPAYASMSTELQTYLDRFRRASSTSVGNSIDADTLAKRMRAHLKSIGITGFTIHGLRPLRGTELAEAGCSEHEIVAQLGHVTPLRGKNGQGPAFFLRPESQHESPSQTALLWIWPKSDLGGLMTFPAERVVPIIRFLEDSGIPVWLDGGWDIDALLQTQTRDHLDLDLIIPDPNLEAAELALGTLGFVRDERATWLPLRLVLRTPEGLEIDIHPVVFNSPFDADRMRANGVSADIQDIRALQNRFELAVPESYFDNPVAG